MCLCLRKQHNNENKKPNRPERDEYICTYITHLFGWSCRTKENDNRSGPNRHFTHTHTEPRTHRCTHTYWEAHSCTAPCTHGMDHLQLSFSVSYAPTNDTGFVQSNQIKQIEWNKGQKLHTIFTHSTFFLLCWLRFIVVVDVVVALASIWSGIRECIIEINKLACYYTECYFCERET